MRPVPDPARIARELIAPLIPPATKSRVERAYRQRHQAIREHLRAETGLRLATGEARRTVPIRLQDGFRDPLAALIGDLDDPTLWQLILAQPYILGLQRGTAFLLEHWPRIRTWPRLPDALREAGSALAATRELGTLLSDIIAAVQLQERVAAIQDDLLGAYFSGPKVAIELYWMPIGMFSSILGCPIEDLTAVVLAHELAHAYTHVGLDIDGQQWETPAFQRTDRAIKEGLAQFYTAEVVTKLSARTPGILDAYERLLGWQSGPYLLHLTWAQDTRNLGERVRAAMLSCRNQELTAYSQFVERMQEAAVGLRRVPRPRQDTLL